MSLTRIMRCLLSSMQVAEDENKANERNAKKVLYACCLICRIVCWVAHLSPRCTKQIEEDSEKQKRALVQRLLIEDNRRKQEFEERLRNAVWIPIEVRRVCLCGVLEW